MSDEGRVYEDEDRHRRWAEGCRRETAIGELLKRHEGKRLKSSDVADVARELGIIRATLYRLIEAYRTAQTVQALEPRSRGRRQGTFVLDKAREALIAKTIREIYLHPSRPNLTYLVEQVHARFAAKGWPAPDRRTVKARVDAIDRRVRALKRRDTQGIKATRAVPGEYVATGPLETVQIDHTQVNIFLVDEVTRKPFEFIETWNELLIAASLITTDEKRLLTVGFYQYVTSFGVEWGSSPRPPSYLSFQSSFCSSDCSDSS